MYCNILVTKPFDHTFTYKIRNDQNVKLGSIVSVSFGKKKDQIGIVYELCGNTIKKNISYKIKEIDQIYEGIFLYKNLGLFKNLSYTATNFSSSVIVIATIISFYLIPFLFIEIINKRLSFKETLKNKIFVINFIIIFFFIIFTSFNFIYDNKIGGGFFIKLNNLFFEDYFYYLILSVLLSTVVIYFSRNQLIDNFITVVLLISFPSGYFIFQKYFEPMYLIVFVLLYDKKMLTNLIKNNLSFLNFYFLLYWVLYFIYKEKDKFLYLF